MSCCHLLGKKIKKKLLRNLSPDSIPCPEILDEQNLASYRQATQPNRSHRFIVYRCAVLKTLLWVSMYFRTNCQNTKNAKNANANFFTKSYFFFAFLSVNICYIFVKC